MVRKRCVAKSAVFADFSVSASTTLASVAHQRTSHERSYKQRSTRSMFIRARSLRRTPLKDADIDSLMFEIRDSVFRDRRFRLATTVVDVLDSPAISIATMLNALPASPARAASMRAFKARTRI